MLTERVIAIIADRKRIPRDQISLDSTFEELGVDSLTGIAIIYSLEEEFDITIPDDVAREIRSVREIVEKLEQHFAEAGGTGGHGGPPLQGAPGA